MEKHPSHWQDWTNLMLGIWLLLAPIVGIGAADSVVAWNSYLAGTVVVLFAGTAILLRQAWEEWVNLIAAVWLILAPFALGFSNQQVPMWNQIIVGFLVGIDALWAVIYIPAPRQLL